MVSRTDADAAQTLRIAPSNDGGRALREAIVRAAAWTAGGHDHRARVVLEPGLHRVEPDGAGDHAAIVISDAARLSIEGPGAELLFVDPRRGGIEVRDATDVTLVGFRMDWASPSFTQGEIIEVDAGAGVFRFRPQSGYPDFTDRILFTGAGYGTLRDRRDGARKPGVRQTFMISYADTSDADGAFRVTVDDSDRAWFSDIQVGDGFVVGHRGDRHGIRLEHCDRITLRDLTMHASPCAAILAHETSATLLERVTVARREGSSRWISTNADAVHCQGGRRGPQIIGCRFEGMHDDGVNLYVRALDVLDVLDALTLVIDGDGSLQRDDRLQLVDAASGRVLGESQIAAVGASSPCTVTLRHPLPDGVGTGTAIYNRSNALPGFRIEQTRFHDFRGIGIRLKASSGIIADCRFERLAGCGLWIANDPGWSEGPLGSRDVDIVGNVFRDAPEDLSLQTWPHSAATVMIELFAGDDGPADARAHERIRLRGVDITQSAAAAVFVGAASEVFIEDVRVAEKDGAAWLATRDSDVQVREATVG